MVNRGFVQSPFKFQVKGSPFPDTHYRIFTRWMYQQTLLRLPWIVVPINSRSPSALILIHLWFRVMQEVPSGAEVRSNCCTGVTGWPHDNRGVEERGKIKREWNYVPFSSPSDSLWHYFCPKDVLSCNQAPVPLCPRRAALCPGCAAATAGLGTAVVRPGRLPSPAINRNEQLANLLVDTPKVFISANFEYVQ